MFYLIKFKKNRVRKIILLVNFCFFIMNNLAFAFMQIQNPDIAPGYPSSKTITGKTPLRVDSSATQPESSTAKTATIKLDSVISLNSLNVSADGIEFIKKHEGVVTNVYNDRKGGKSDYCKEHFTFKSEDIFPKKGHELKNSVCTDSIHINTKTLKFGKPTVCIGYLINTEQELQKFCLNALKETITNDTCHRIFTEISLPDHVADLKKALLADLQLTQCQFDALSSICFNRGITNFKRSSLYKKYLKDQPSIDLQFKDDLKEALINDGSDKIVKKRRKSEADLFFDCAYVSK